MKKPDIPDPRHPEFAQNVRTTLEIVTGRRRNKLTVAPIGAAAAAGASPTKAEFDALLADVKALRSALAALVSRLDD